MNNSDTKTLTTGEIRWRGEENISFDATSGSGHLVMIDSQQVIGAKPMELILIGLGGCASYDVVSILQKSRQALSDVRCQVTAERATTIPAVFTKVHLHFVVTGTDIKEAQVAKAVELSVDKYCSASKMLSDGGVLITHDYEIVVG